MKSDDSAVGRRTFLITSSVAIAATTLAARFTAGCASVGAPPGPQTTNLTVADVAEGAAVVPSGANYIVARDSIGFFAYSNVCTHQGCALAAPPASGMITCPCHGAEFDSKGDNVHGPNGSAPIASLEHYQVTFTGTGATAAIVVDTSIVETDRTVRAAAPA